MSSGFLSKFAICTVSYMLPPTLIQLILIFIILITLAFLVVRPGEQRVATMFLSRILHVIIVGLSTARGSFAGPLACDSLESCKVGLYKH